ncbi:MAG: 16S rRNA (guanine(527)-N(7))-methyltransferase RsmG [Vicinamibacterales bacterium]
MAARDFHTRLVRRAAKAGLFPADALVDSLVEYYELLARWNRKINLTALSDPDEAIDRLLLEPLAAARHLPDGTARVMDIGSGGGSPAIPLKLAAPHVALTMVEVKVRKSAFLREAIRHLDLSDTEVENSRYEELLARPELHERFDVLTIRAVRVQPKTLMSLQAFVRPLGTLMLFRGAEGGREPESHVPALSYAATVPLLEATQSRLTLLSKRPIGH